MSPSVKNTLKYLVVFAIGAFFLVFVFRDIHWKDLFDRLASANLYWLGMGMAISIFSHWIRARRALQLYNAMGFQVSASNSFAAVLIGYFMNYFIPRAGEVSRCAALSKTNQVPVEKSLGSVVTERVVDMLILFLILAIIFILQFDFLMRFLEGYGTETPNQASSGSNLKFILGILILVGLMGVYLLRKQLAKLPLVQRFAGLFAGFAEGLMSIRKLKNPGLFIAESLLIWICYILMMYFCLFALDSTSHLGVMECLTVFAIGTIGVVLPAPGAGAGTYHFFVMQALLLFGVAKEDGIAYATLVHGAQMLILILLGLLASFYVFMKGKTENGKA
ncbi:MAG: flippase-like domain-containing protein [Bacteroidetes bacterium]|nr:flippase-like domain-containing protein [Bacteroidota bacterium]